VVVEKRVRSFGAYPRKGSHFENQYQFTASISILLACAKPFIRVKRLPVSHDRTVAAAVGGKDELLFALSNGNLLVKAFLFENRIENTVTLAVAITCSKNSSKTRDCKSSTANAAMQQYVAVKNKVLNLVFMWN